MNQENLIEMIVKEAKWVKSRRSGEIELEEVNVPFTYKNNAIFLHETKIADIKKDQEGEPEFHFTHNDFKSFGGDALINYYADAAKGDLLKENQKDEIEVPVTVSDIEESSDSSIDGSGDEYSFLYAEDFKVHFNHVDVTKLLNQKEEEKVRDLVDEHLNKDYTPKYYGTHRTY